VAGGCPRLPYDPRCAKLNMLRKSMRPNHFGWSVLACLHASCVNGTGERSRMYGDAIWLACSLNAAALARARRTPLAIVSLPAAMPCRPDFCLRGVMLFFTLIILQNTVQT
jgi:hypothetical protein